jgi:hypothetical protein
MRLEVTLKVRFEAQPGQPANVLEAALRRGISRLKTGIEIGMRGGGTTGIKAGSTTVEELDKRIT